MAEARKRGAVFTIGHSNHTFAYFASLLRMHGIEAVVDVRSFPVSRLQWFSKNAISKRLHECGIRYTFLGDELGGRNWTKADGTLMHHEEIVVTERFRTGLQRLAAMTTAHQTSIMCSEGHAANCHRTTLIAPALESSMEIFHISIDGSLRRNSLSEAQLSLWNDR